MNAVMLRASSFSPRMGIQPFGGGNVSIDYTICRGAANVVNCELNVRGEGRFHFYSTGKPAHPKNPSLQYNRPNSSSLTLIGTLISVDWLHLFPSPKDCVTQTSPAYFQVEHASQEPVILMYCASTTNETYAELCENFEKTRDEGHHDLLGNYTDDQEGWEGIGIGEGGKRAGRERKRTLLEEEDFVWGAVFPHQLKNKTLSLLYEGARGVEVAFCAQTWNKQATNITFETCWENVISDQPHCQTMVQKHNVSRVFGIFPPAYPENELVRFKMTWSEFTPNLRIFVAVLGEKETVYQVCKNLV